jgi:5-methylcytosine-specific restriction endonuclease McrA
VSHAVDCFEPESDVSRRDALLRAAYERQKAERLAMPKLRTRSQRFIDTPEWKALRLECLAILGDECCKCGSLERPQVDHVQSRYYSPDLSMRLWNLQVLCKECNFEKGTQSIDYRTRRQVDSLLRAESNEVY